MKKTLTVFATLLRTFAEEIEALAEEAATPEPAAAAVPKKRGRQPKTDEPQATGEPAAIPLDPAANVAAKVVNAQEPEPVTTGGKSYEELQDIIRPVVSDPACDRKERKEAVKAVIAKYAANLKELATMPEKHADFEKDIEALTY